MGQRWCARGRLVAVAVIAVAVLAGCTSTADISGATLAPLSSAVGGTIATGTNTSTGAQSLSAASLSLEEPTVTTTSAESSDTLSEAETTPTADTPWAGLNLTEAQITDAEAAVAAYRGYSSAVDQSATDPTKDWSQLIRSYATDPAASDWLEFLSRPAVQLGRGSGVTLINPTVTKVEPALVTISDCIDTTQTSFVGPDGESLVAPDQQGTYKRHPAVIEVAQFDGGNWLVTYITDDYQVRC